MQSLYTGMYTTTRRDIIVIEFDIEARTRRQITETHGATSAAVIGTGSAGAYQTVTIRCLEPDYAAAQSLIAHLSADYPSRFVDTINGIDIRFDALDNIRAEAVKTSRAARWIVTFEGKIR